jgi:hypothetical protein
MTPYSSSVWFLVSPVDGDTVAVNEMELQSLDTFVIKLQGRGAVFRQNTGRVLELVGLAMCGMHYSSSRIAELRDPTRSGPLSACMLHPIMEICLLLQQRL